MPNVMRIKRRVSGAVGAPSGLATGELAWNMADNTIYGGKGDNGSGVATSVVAVAGDGAFALLNSPAFVGTPTAPTQANGDNSTRLATTAFVKSLGYGPGSVTSVGLSLPGIFTVSGSPVSGAGTLTGSLVSQAANLVFASPDTTSGTPTFRSLVATDIPTLTAAKISNFDTQVRTSRLDQMAAPAADVSFNGVKITGLAEPVSPQDAATKAYCDATKQGLDVKDSVRAATTAPITLSGTQTVDGVALVVGDRVLVKDQATASANGIYVVASGGWTRGPDADTSAKVTAGLFTFVTEGTANADSGWVLITNDLIVLDTTALSFTQFSGAGQVSAGAGLTRTGNTLDVVGTANRITVNADSIDIASTYAGQTSITTLGTIGTGVWQATAVGLAYGGTGANLGGAADGTLFKKSGSAMVAAVLGTDYLSNASDIDGGTF